MTTQTSDVFILDAVRTPFGKYGGALADVRPDDLAATALKALLDRSPALDPATIDDVLLGDANGAGEDNRNVARMAALLAGLPPSVPGCDREPTVRLGPRGGDRGVAGGVESMTRAPWVLLKPATGFPRGHEQLHSTTLGWRMVNPRHRGEWAVALGEGAEILADRYDISRDAQDEFALRSHRNASTAWKDGLFADEVVAVDGVELERDESIRADTSLVALGRLKPAFRPDGTVTAGNASPLNDGASTLLLADERGATATGRRPIARIVSRASHAVEPQLFGIAPVEAARKALQRAGISWGDLRLVELNEAFAAQSLACLAEWPDLDPAVVNVNGGAIAIGHALGSSGSRILVTLVHELRRRGGGFGLAAICIGVGQALAVVVEVEG
jgi:acetyl-CoA acetyltransferase family protein